MEPLNPEKINEATGAELKEWSYEDEKLKRTYTFRDFREAIAFMVRVGFEAEAAMHHPEMSNTYNRVSIALTTHDAGNRVTEKDLALAAAIEGIYKKD